MAEMRLLGLKNCDTMKKAFKWLDGKGITYQFHDYKKEGADEDVLRLAMARYGWENVMNRRGTTWRKLPDDVKENMNQEKAINCARDNPSVIKRPILIHGQSVLLGFDESAYRDALLQGDRQ